MRNFETVSDALGWVDANAVPGTLLSVCVNGDKIVVNRRGAVIGAYPAYVGFGWLRPVPGDMMEFGK